MKFNNAAEALQFYVQICAVGVFPSGGSVIQSDEMRVVSMNKGQESQIVWDDLVHAKVDIEAIFIKCFPQEWIQKIMLLWAVDGYEEVVGKHLPKISHLHRRMTTYSREDILESWITRLTIALVRGGYVKKDVFNRKEKALNIA